MSRRATRRTGLTKDLPDPAQTMIIGGGSIGINTAYHLTKLGHSDVVVLE